MTFSFLSMYLETRIIYFWEAHKLVIFDISASCMYPNNYSNIHVRPILTALALGSEKTSLLQIFVHTLNNSPIWQAEAPADSDYLSLLKYLSSASDQRYGAPTFCCGYSDKEATNIAQEAALLPSRQPRSPLYFEEQCCLAVIYQAESSASYLSSL